MPSSGPNVSRILTAQYTHHSTPVTEVSVAEVLKLDWVLEHLGVVDGTGDGVDVRLGSAAARVLQLTGSHAFARAQDVLRDAKIWTFFPPMALTDPSTNFCTSSTPYPLSVTPAFLKSSSISSSSWTLRLSTNSAHSLGVRTQYANATGVNSTSEPR
jgi:hypothetical protein